MIASLNRVAIPASIEFTPYIYTNISYQSNLFLSTKDSSDTIFQFSPGTRGILDYKRQKLYFDLSLLRNEFDSLDFTGGDANFNWDWLYGSNWEGIASYNYIDEQSNFSEQLSKQGDSREINKLSVTANRILNPRYKLLSGLNYKTKDYKRRDSLSIDERLIKFGVRYTSLANNSIDLFFLNNDSKYPNRNEQDIARNLDDGFTQNSLLAKVSWEPTFKSSLQFEAGYIDRQQDNISDDDFTGIIGNITHYWLYSGKTKIISSIWRDIQDSEDQVSNFIESDGVSLELLWDMTAKISASVRLKHEKKDFIGNGRRNDSISRKDDFSNGLVGLNYNLRRNIVLTTQFGYETRDSNRPLREYNNKFATLGLQIEF